MAGDSEKDITAEELATWLTPRQALNVVQQAFPDIGVAARTIMERIKGGLIRTGAKSSSWGESGRPTSTTLIPAGYWSRQSGISKPADWWDTGDVRFFFPANRHGSASTGRYFGVRFEPSSVQAIVADAPKKPIVKPIVKASPPAATITSAAPQASPAESNKGGRPRKEFWDDLWVALCGQIYSGALIPDKQAAIEKAMLDWAASNGHELSEQSARTRSRKLFAVLKKDKN